MTQTINHKFTKGDILPLDLIYDIQGIGSGWWEFYDDRTSKVVTEFSGKKILEPSGETIIITKNIQITIKIKTDN